jgi:hypothetical protein
VIDEPPIVQQAERVRTGLRLLVLVLVGVGAAAGIGGFAVGGFDGIAIGCAIAALAWSSAAGIHFTWLSAAQPQKRTHRVQTADGVEFRLVLRPQLPLSMLAFGGGFAVFFGWMTVWTDSPLLRVLTGLLALLGLVVVPDATRALAAKDRGAVLDAAGLTYRGYSYETTTVPWDSIPSGTFDASNPRVPAMTFKLRQGTTLTWTRRRWLAHLEPKPRPDRFTIPAIVFDQPWSVLATCNGMAQAPAEHRAEYLASVGGQMLTDPAFPHH